jgi:hypothetical protein
MRVFVSWSGPRSHKIALELRKWLRSVIQGIEVLVSSEDIRKGERWSSEIGRMLEESDFGIVCVLPDNVAAPWIHFEAGALSKAMVGSHVIPLLFDVPISAIGDGPLAQFQAATFSSAEMLKVAQSINEARGASALDREALEHVVAMCWPSLDAAIALALATEPSTPAASVVVPDKEMDDEAIRILSLFGRLQPDVGLKSTDVAGRVQLSPQRASLHLWALEEKGLLSFYRSARGEFFELSQDGRRELAARRLLP